MRDHPLRRPGHGGGQGIGRHQAGISIPLVADIHFHYQLALEALAQGVDCLRLNPGNIRDPDRVREVVREAKRARSPFASA